ncbi:MAG: hypothetical protein R3Y24_11950 [Eubacteriales bacterium]
MEKKSIVEQIKATQMALEKAQEKKQQKEHLLEKLESRERGKEQRLRTRRLIERGAILESTHPAIISLSNEQLQAYLLACLQTQQAENILAKICNSSVVE